MLSQTVVDPDGPAFGTPSKPIEPMYDEATARQLASENGWTVAPEGPGWRRVVPSPMPLEIVESAAPTPPRTSAS